MWGLLLKEVSTCLGVEGAGIASVTTLYAKSSVFTVSLSWAWPTGRRLSTSAALSLPRMCQLILELLQVQEPPFYSSRWGLGLTVEHCDHWVVVCAYLKLNSIEVQVELLTCPSDG